MTSLGERFGTLSLPVDVPAVKAARTLTVLDPGRRLLCNLFQAAIRAELQEAWTQACAGIDGTVEKFSTTDPCPDVIELEPTGPTMGQRQAEFPLLAVYRSGQGVYETDTFYADKLTQQWTVDWILGPATVARAFQLTDTAVAIAKIISRVLSRSGHPAYEDGAIQFGSDTNFGSIRLVNHEGPGQAKFAGDDNGTVYWAISLRLETTEHVDDTAAALNFGTFEGADYDVGIGGAPEGVIPGLLYASTDPVLQPQF